MKAESKPKSLTFRVVNNALAFMGGRFTVRLIKFLTVLCIIRVLSEESYGQLSFIYVYLSFFDVFVQFGFNSVLTREVSQNRDEGPRILGNAVLFRMGMCVMTIPLAFVLIKALDYPFSVEQGVILASFQLFLTLRAVYDVIYRVELKMIYPALWNTVRACISIALVAFAAIYRPSIQSFIGAYLISGFICLFGFMIFTRRFIQIDYRPDLRLLGRLIKESWPLLLSGYLTLIYYRVDIFMLSKMRGFLEVGLYSVATRITESLGIIATSLLVSLFPILSQAFKDDRKRFENIISKAFKILMLAAFPIAIGGSLVAHELVIFLFGEAYAASGGTLMLLLWYTFFFFLGTLLANILIVCRKQIIDAWISFSLVLLNIGLNLVLIPRYSYNGAALATVVVEIAGVLLILIYVVRSREIRMPMPMGEFATALAVNLPFLGFLLILKFYLQLPFPGVIGLGGLGYGALLMAFRIVTYEQIRRYIFQWRNPGEHSK